MTAAVRLLVLLRDARGRVALGLLLGMITIASGVGLIAIGASLLAAAANDTPLVALAIPIYLVRLLAVTRAFSRYAERLVSHQLTLTLLAQVRLWFFTRLEPLAPARLLEYPRGDLLARIVDDVEAVEQLYLRLFSPVVIALLTAIVVVGLLLPYGAALAGAVGLAYVFAGLAVPLLTRTLARGVARGEVAARGALHAAIAETIQAIADLLAFGVAAQQHHAQLDALNGRLATLRRRAALVESGQQALQGLAANAAGIAVLAMAIPLVALGRIGGSTLLLLLLVTVGGFEAIQPLGAAIQALEGGVAAGERLFEITDAQPRVTNPPAPIAPPSRGRAPAIAFVGVSFTYPTGAEPALRHVDLAVQAGSRVAFVGPSGAGKSTLGQLLLRFWDPAEGAVLLDTNDLRRYALDDLRDTIAVVSQQTHLFTGTVRSNLLLARPDAADADLWRVIEQAQLSAFVTRLPRGLDTWVGEQGVMLSGGERQRLAVARALLKDSPVVLLDEPTANLDPVTEHDLLQRLWQATSGRTVLVITHRLVAMEEMDEIIVLDHGHIVERGTHATLAASGRVYRRLLDAQADELGSLTPAEGAAIATAAESPRGGIAEPARASTCDAKAVRASMAIGAEPNHARYTTREGAERRHG